MSKKADSSEIEEVTGASIQTPDVTGADEVIKENPEKENPEKIVIASPKAKKPKRYGLERFLQLYPQSPYVEAILRMWHATEVMTAEEWLALIDSILHNKPRAIIGGR